MSRPPRRSRSTAAAAGTVRGDSALGRALETQRYEAKDVPEYLAILDTIASGSDAGLHFDQALEGAEDASINETARRLLDAVALASITSKRALALPKRRATSEASYRKLFAALKTLGAHFGLRDFPTISMPPDPPGLNAEELDAQFRLAVKVHQAAEGLAKLVFQDPGSLRLLARIGYKKEGAPQALLAMWEHLSVERHATMGGLSEPGLSRKQVKDADRWAFILRLDAGITTVLGRRDVGFLTAMTNILFDTEGTGGFSNDAIRQYLKRASERGDQL